jgi:NAD(P)H-hydrate epimerase
MAVGGSGDALTGLIAGLWASGYSREDAVLLGVALHGTAGECFESEFGRMGLTAGELIKRIPQAWKILQDAR